jgi:hypothetical protein
MYFVQDVPVRYKHLSNTLRVLCLFPAVWGVYNHLAEANSIDNRQARALDPTKSSALDNYVGILWVSNRIQLGLVKKKTRALFAYNELLALTK